MCASFWHQRANLKKLLDTGISRKRKNGNDAPVYYQGVYISSRSESDTSWKFGMAHGFGGLIGRLGDYKLGFPYYSGSKNDGTQKNPKTDEFWIHFLIVAKK
jgi:hypothetical protein